MVAQVPHLTTQERHVTGCLLAIVSLHDHWRWWAEALERQLLLEVRQREQQAILDLRDGVVYLAGVAGHAWLRDEGG